MLHVKEIYGGRRPDKTYVSDMTHQCWPHKAAISIQQGVPMYEARLIIPSSLRLDILDRIHEGHQGISKCRERTNQSVWWPGLSRQIGHLVHQCRICCKNKPNVVESLICSDIPDNPWLTIAADLFEYHNRNIYSQWITIRAI